MTLLDKLKADAKKAIKAQNTKGCVRWQMVKPYGGKCCPNVIHAMDAKIHNDAITKL